MDSTDPSPFSWYLGLRSFGVFTLWIVLILTSTYFWYHNKPFVPAFILSIGILTGLAINGTVAVVAGILLVGVVVSTILRAPVLARKSSVTNVPAR